MYFLIIGLEGVHWVQRNNQKVQRLRGDHPIIPNYGMNIEIQGNCDVPTVDIKEGKTHPPRQILD